MSAPGPARLAVLVSGRGSNLRAILGACGDGRVRGSVVAVASNRPSCPALDIARAGGVPLVRAFTLGEHGDVASRDRAMASALQAAGVDLVVTAGYDRVLDDAFVTAFAGRIINVHPSMLPAFGGSMTAIEDAFRAGVPATGVTVHMIEPGTVDGGTVLASEAVPILAGDTLETLEARVHAVEHRLLPEVIQGWIESHAGAPSRARRSSL